MAFPLSDWRIQTVSSLRSSPTALYSAGVKFLLGGFARLIASQILILAISTSCGGATEYCNAASIGAAMSIGWIFGVIANFGPFNKTAYSGSVSSVSCLFRFGKFLSGEVHKPRRSEIDVSWRTSNNSFPELVELLNLSILELLEYDICSAVTQECHLVKILG